MITLNEKLDALAASLVAIKSELDAVKVRVDSLASGVDLATAADKIDDLQATATNIRVGIGS